MTQVRMPTGETVEMPDNPTPEQLAALAQINGTNSAPAQSNPASAGGVAPAAPAAPVRGKTEQLMRSLGLSVRPVAEAAAGTVGMLGDALNTAINMGGQAIGHNPHLGMPTQVISQAIDAMLPKPENTKEKVVNALAGMGYGAMGADPLANAIAARLPKATPRQPTEREQAILNAQKEGYVVTPDQVPGTGIKGKIAEFVMGKKPLTQQAQLRNQQVTNDLARTDLSMAPGAPLNNQTLQSAIEANYAAGYEPIKQAGKMSNGKLYRQALNKIVQDYGGASTSFPDAADTRVEQLVGQYRVPKFDAADAVQQIQNLRLDANSAFKRGDNRLGLAGKALADALEGSIGANLNYKGQSGADMLKAFQDARTQIAKLGTVQRAVREGTGDVNAASLARVYQNNPSLLTDKLRTIGQFANVAPKMTAIPTEQTPVQSLWHALGTGVPGMAIGSLIGGTPGAALGSALPLARGAGRAAMLSPLGQRMIAPSGFNPGLLEQLLGNQYTQQAMPQFLMQTGLYGQPQQK